MLNFETAHVFVTVFLCAKNCHKGNEMSLYLQIPQEAMAIMAHLRSKYYLVKWNSGIGEPELAWLEEQIPDSMTA